MSLTWDVGDVKDNGTVCFIERSGKRYMSDVTQFLIHQCVSVMLGKITEENIDEWIVRNFMYRRSCNQQTDLYDDNGKDRCLTREDLVKHIGLSTNVSTRTRDEFIKDRVIRNLEYDAKVEALKK
jgi:hypothetical protein